MAKKIEFESATWINTKSLWFFKGIFIGASVFLLSICIYSWVMSLNSKEDFIIAVVWFVIILIITIPIMLSRKVAFNDENAFYSNCFSHRLKKINLESIDDIKVTFFGYFSIISFMDKNRSRRIVTINKFNTAIRNNRMDFIGIKAKFQNEVDVIDLLKTKINLNRRSKGISEI